jgi:hypothetical protein
MKYRVTFQDRITYRVVNAEDESEASIKAQKLVKDLIVIHCEPVNEPVEPPKVD